MGLQRLICLVFTLYYVVLIVRIILSWVPTAAAPAARPDVAFLD